MTPILEDLTPILDESRPQGVTFDIPADGEKMVIPLDGKRFKAALVQMARARAMVMGVPTLGMGYRQPSQEQYPSAG
jgi:hypothetical protein